MMYSTITSLCVTLGFVLPALGAVRPARVFGDHMVLQRDMPVIVWGTADAGEMVTVTIGSSKATTKAIADGQWRVRLSPLPASRTPMTLKINDRVIQDVLVGEVWVSSGQSNMEFGLSNVINAQAETAKGDDPEFRLLRVPHQSSGWPMDAFDARWEVSTAKNADGFDAVSTFFARELRKNLNVPVGIINAAWGGTHINGFIPIEGFESEPALGGELGWYRETWTSYVRAREEYVSKMVPWLERAKPLLAAGKPIPDPPGVSWPGDPMASRHLPASLYHAMVQPLVPFAMRGVIWYQGEMNLIDGLFYYTRMRALIQGWRKVWGQGEFPFYYVQLAPCRCGDWRLPQMWEAQTRVMLTVPNTGMAVTNDIGDPNDVHPKNKQDVGRRLGRWALAKTYGIKNLAYSGPIYESMSVEGNKIRIRFKYADGGLTSRDGKPLTWFTIAGADKKFVPAEATIEGDTVVVSSPAVANPKAVRFAWHDTAEPNLMNNAGLPASAFRTDMPPASAYESWRGASKPAGPED